MTPKRVIPCLDVKDGRVVKGTNFLALKDTGDPVELAAHYERDGADEIVLLDITATSEGRKTMRDVVRRTAEVLTVPFTVGGGISTVEDMHHLLEAGADKVSINSAAVRHPELVTGGAHHFGSERLVVAIDARRRAGDAGLSAQGGASSAADPQLSSGPTSGPTSWEVYTHGGRSATGMDPVQWAVEVARRGAGEILLTSMDGDGTRHGYDIELLAALTPRLRIPVVASGGAGTLSHIRQALVDGGADAVLAASIFHHGTFTIQAVKSYLARQGISVRV